MYGQKQFHTFHQPSDEVNAWNMELPRSHAPGTGTTHLTTKFNPKDYDLTKVKDFPMKG